MRRSTLVRSIRGRSPPLEIAAAHGLTAYDAAYVAVAERNGWTLVSTDIADLVSKGLAVAPTPPSTLAVSVLEQVQSDVRTAMKARERERAAALRLVVDVLQQDAKLGKGDEVAVLQRERKKRVEAAEAYEGAGRAEQAAAERFEAELIEGYLPQQLSDEELGRWSTRRSPRPAPRDEADGPGDVGADAEARRPRRRQAGQRRGAEKLGS